tara:strand:+ start:588 stop:908 length:321 start_codon:yes stop_codon:yes gene_type:complete
MKKLILFSALLIGQIAFAKFPVNTKVIDNQPTIEVVVSDESASPVASKSQVTALVLCVLLGGIGVHRYYLGDILEGVIQTLTLGGLGIWTLIDLIRICTGALGPGW